MGGERGGKRAGGSWPQALGSGHGKRKIVIMRDNANKKERKREDGRWCRGRSGRVSAVRDGQGKKGGKNGKKRKREKGK
jgi:hypothetical protein